MRTPLMISRWRGSDTTPVVAEAPLESFPTGGGTTSERQTPDVSVLFPLATRDGPIVRTSERISGLDGTVSRIVWHYPPSAGDFGLSGASTAADDDDKNERLQLRWQRIWWDSVYGQMTSDGSRLYAIDGMDQVIGSEEVRRARALALINRETTASPRLTNRLVALDLNREGALAWWVGNASGENEPRSGRCLFPWTSTPVGREPVHFGRVARTRETCGNGRCDRASTLGADPGRCL